MTQYSDRAFMLAPRSSTSMILAATRLPTPSGENHSTRPIIFVKTSSDVRMRPTRSSPASPTCESITEKKMLKVMTPRML